MRDVYLVSIVLDTYYAEINRKIEESQRFSEVFRKKTPTMGSTADYHLGNHAVLYWL
jgi:hypothetical protein